VAVIGRVVKTRWTKEQHGFIFSLDAALAITVIMLVMAGVARVGTQSFHESYGYLRLERYANDALEALYNVGSLDDNGSLLTAYDNIRTLLANGQITQAEIAAENWFCRILTSDLQFKFLVGEENNPLLDNVFPTTGNHEAWQSAFENAQEIAVASRVWIIDNSFYPAKIYVWRWPSA